MTGALEGILKEKDIPFAKNVSTASLSTFRIGGVCRYLISPRCHGEMLDALLLLRQAGLSYAVIGQGSNLLFDDGPLDMAVLRTTGLCHRCHTGDGELLADCGTALPVLARLAARCGFSDFAFAAGIPGTVGGGVLMNAGAHGKSLASLVKSVTALNIDTGEIRTYFNNELAFSYRNSIFQKGNWAILRACFCCTQQVGEDASLREMRRLQACRAATQPLALPNAGSVFRRPAEGVSMGYIIDKLGLKGLRCGGAAVSEKHAGFIVNLGGATAADVRKLITQIKDITESRCGFRPVCEIRFVSEGGVS